MKHPFTSTKAQPPKSEWLVDEEWFTDEVSLWHARGGPFSTVLRIHAIIAKHEILI